MPRNAVAPQHPATLDVSVLIPTFRREKTIALAVESVLGPSPLQIEVLVADDSPEGSARDAVNAIADPRVHYLHRDQPTGGVPARVRNELLARSRGRFLYFLDDDDTVSLEALVAIVRSMQTTGRGVGIGVVCPHGPEDSPVVAAEREHYARARLLMPRIGSRYELASRLMFKNSLICCSACVIRRDTFLTVGGFDTDLPLYEDVELYIQAIRRDGFVFVDQPFLNRRTGEPSLLQNERDARRSVQSYQMMYQRYRSSFGTIEWMLLRAWALALR